MADLVNGRKGSFDIGHREFPRKLSLPSILSKLSIFKRSVGGTANTNKSMELSLYKHSSVCLEHICDFCSVTGDDVNALGFCKECDKFLCGTCFKCHVISNTSGKHVIRDKDSVPKKFCDLCSIEACAERAAKQCVDCSGSLCTGCGGNQSLKNAPEATQETESKENLTGFRIQRARNDECTYIKDIYCKTETDKDDCYVTDIVFVSDSELVLADVGNQSLKLLDIERNVVTYSLSLQAPVFGLTFVPPKELAIVPAKQSEIQIVRVSEGLSVVRTFQTGGSCSGVKYSHGKLFISFYDPLKFQIFSMTGEVEKTIIPKPEVLEYCTTPRHIALSPDQSLIYVSDWRTQKIMSIDMEGNKKSQYPGELARPLDVTISPNGEVYLCSRENHVIYRMSADLAEASIVLGKEDGLDFPQTLCFDARRKNLYIGGGDTISGLGSFIQVIEWKQNTKNEQFYL